jgi:hypothetical protein
LLSKQFESLGIALRTAQSDGDNARNEVHELQSTIDDLRQKLQVASSTIATTSARPYSESEWKEATLQLDKLKQTVAINAAATTKKQSSRAPLGPYSSFLLGFGLAFLLFSNGSDHVVQTDFYS